MGKLISIIIATYNAGATLDRCLKSIAYQKNSQCELLLIDGNSKDNTLEIINGYQESIDYFISEKDNGVYDAWNKGISIATGNWIMFIGADDILNPKALETYINFLENTFVDNIDFICARNAYINKSGRFLKMLGEPYSWHKYRKYMCVAHVGSLHRSTLFTELGPYNLEFKICGDYELLMRKKNKLSTYFIDTEIAKMQEGGLSLSLKAIYETFRIRKRHQSVNYISNYYLLFKGIIFSYLFKLKYRIL